MCTRCSGSKEDKTVNLGRKLVELLNEQEVTSAGWSQKSDYSEIGSGHAA